jgi:hypothetical protein
MISSIHKAQPKQISETYRVFEEIINSLDDDGLNELLGGESDDIDRLFMNMMDEIFGVIYTGNAEIDLKPYYLDKLGLEMEEILRRENLNYFITSVLPEFIMGWHHMEWGNLAMEIKKLAILAARDHGKSYFFSHAYILWQLYRFGITNKVSKRPTMNAMANKRGFLFSFSIQQAVDLLDIVKNTISENNILREKLFPGSLKDGWAKIDITCKNGARLTVRGFGSSVRGAHPGWIVVDDPLKDNAIYSSVQRKKGIDYFHSVIMNMVVPEGDVKVVGTPFHANDLYGDLKSKKGWMVREYPAIFPNGDLLWQERWDFPGLMEKRNTQGNMIFSRELLCRPVTNESSIFPPEIISKAFFKMQDLKLVKNRDSYGIKFNRVVTGCDFSISSSIGADYSVFITAGVDEEERLWLMNFVRFKGKSFADQIATLKSINSRFKPDVMMMETNVFQQIFAEESGKQGLPVVGHNTGKDKYDFKHGVPGLALAFERGMIKIPRGDQESIDVADTISLELSSITWTEKGLEGVGEHDDCGMALWQTWLASKHTGGFRFRFL